MTDPFTPPATAGVVAPTPPADASPALVEQRYARAGLDEETRARLGEWFAGLTPERQREYAGQLDTLPDHAIAERYTVPDGDLSELTVDRLADLCRARGVPHTGAKADLVERLSGGESAPRRSRDDH